MSVRKIILLVGLLCALAYVTYNEWRLGQSPQVMSPIQSFSELCPSNQTFGSYASRPSRSNARQDDVWEKHFDVEAVTGKINLSALGKANYFDFNDFPLRVELQSPNGGLLKVAAFYDGDQVFKARAMLDEAGSWNYRLLYREMVIEEGVVVREIDTERSALLPVSIDAKHPSRLVTGSNPFYWIGGKWLASQNIAPCTISQFTHLRASQQSLKDKEYIAYLDALVETKHNGILIKIAQFPLMEDGISWDLEWIQRTEWMVREAMSRGIYVQINIFDTWSRDSRFKVVNNTSGERHVFNVWNPDEADLMKIKNYLQTVVARFSSYSNVVWELGNEMEHKPNCGSCFAELANKYYVPWIREFDAFNRVMGLSEGVWTKTSVDIGFMHQTRTSDFESLSQGPRPLVMNELVSADDAEPLWRDGTIRSANARLAFRRTFWRSFMKGLSGSFEATWLNIQEPLNGAVKNVMRDHQRLADFIEKQNINVNTRQVLNDAVVRGGEYLSYSVSLLQGRYISYLLAPMAGALSDKELTLYLPAARYEYQWFNPETGAYSHKQIIDTSKEKSIRVSSESADLVLLIVVAEVESL